MQNEKPKVLFTLVDAGAGHVVPIESVFAVFEKKYGDKCDLVKSYIFSDSQNQDVKNIGKAISTHSKRAMSNWFYNKFEAFSYLLGSKLVHFVLDAKFKKGRKAFFSEFEKINPDLIVSSYYKPSHLAYQSNEKGLTNTLIATYTPDTYVYPAWNKNCHLFLVNNSSAKEMAIKKGFDKKIIKQIPFIYSQSVTELNVDKFRAREVLGIEKEPFTVLFTCGAYGSKKILKLVQTLVKENLPINVVVACGKDEKMLNAVNELKNNLDKTNVYGIGYTDKLATYIKCADLMVGKAGMNTLMEAIYLGCPVVVHDRINRLEELTCQYFEKNKLVIKALKIKKVISLIKTCLTDSECLKEYVERYSKYLDNSGAEQAADSLYQLLKTRFPNL